MVNSVSAVRDYSLFICYDHRKNNELSKISKFLLDDIKQEEKNCFIMQPWYAFTLFKSINPKF